MYQLQTLREHIAQVVATAAGTNNANVHAAGRGAGHICSIQATTLSGASREAGLLRASADGARGATRHGPRTRPRRPTARAKRAGARREAATKKTRFWRLRAFCRRAARRVRTLHQYGSCYGTGTWRTGRLRTHCRTISSSASRPGGRFVRAVPSLPLPFVRAILILRLISRSSQRVFPRRRPPAPHPSHGRQTDGRPAWVLQLLAARPSGCKELRGMMNLHIEHRLSRCKERQHGTIHGRQAKEHGSAL